MKRSLLLLGCLAVALLLTSVASAQVVGTIQGRVMDDSGAALPGVSIVIANVNTGVSTLR